MNTLQEIVAYGQTARLCYVAHKTAVFTTAPLSEQWGDDWNDAPYEHNAGYPYPKDGYCLVYLRYIDNGLETPGERAYSNSAYSVEQINTGAVPWLVSGEWNEKQVSIFAGVTIDEFIALLREGGSDILVPYGELQDAIGAMV